jgi:hypothetical protein
MKYISYALKMQLKHVRTTGTISKLIHLGRNNYNHWDMTTSW